MPQIGLIGLGTMGAALARNFASRDISTAVFNRTTSKTDDFIKNHGNQNLVPFHELESFVNSLESPRKIILMVNAGSAVDQTIEHLLPLLDEKDIIIDCGNSLWKDTIRRETELKLANIHFVGCGVSGGEEGALVGPSIMPGGDTEVVDQILPLLESVAAKDFAGKPCVTNVGLSGAGHFVKMVHNGIEYAMMQGIAEIYDVLKRQSLTNSKIAEIFANLNQGDLKSFLLDITVEILKTPDAHSDGDLIDKISPIAGAKGTGKWTVEAAMDLGVFAPNIAAAVMARIGSAKTQNFKNIYLNEKTPEPITEPEFLDEYLRDAVYGLYLSSYLQGLDLIEAANLEFKWRINLSEVIRIWQGGCIIRSELLATLHHKWLEGFDFYKQVYTLDIYASAVDMRPRPVLRSAVDYLLTLCVPSALPINLIQAQRDFFGAHTYKRIDQEGVFTGGWN